MKNFQINLWNIIKLLIICFIIALLLFFCSIYWSLKQANVISKKFTDKYIAELQVRYKDGPIFGMEGGGDLILTVKQKEVKFCEKYVKSFDQIDEVKFYIIGTATNEKIVIRPSVILLDFQKNGLKLNHKYEEITIDLPRNFRE